MNRCLDFACCCLLLLSAALLAVSGLALRELGALNTHLLIAERPEEIRAHWQIDAKFQKNAQTDAVNVETHPVQRFAQQEAQERVTLQPALFRFATTTATGGTTAPAPWALGMPADHGAQREATQAFSVLGVVLWAGLAGAAAAVLLAGWIWHAVRAHSAPRAVTVPCARPAESAVAQEDMLVAPDMDTTSDAVRTALARDLHDEFGHALTAIHLAAGYIELHAAAHDTQALRESAQDIQQSARHMSQHLRTVLRQLRTSAPSADTLLQALQQTVAQIARQAPHLQLQVQWPQQLPVLEWPAHEALLRTLQEALANVRKHALAQRVRIALAVQDDGLHLLVQDDGHQSAALLMPHEKRTGYGIAGMRERTALAGGVLQVGQAPEGGVAVRLWLPLAKNQNGGHMAC